MYTLGMEHLCTPGLYHLWYTLGYTHLWYTLRYSRRYPGGLCTPVGTLVGYVHPVVYTRLYHPGYTFQYTPCSVTTGYTDTRVLSAGQQSPGLSSEIN